MYPMKKYYLLFVVLLVLFAADSFAKTAYTDGTKKETAPKTGANNNSKKDTVSGVKAEGKANGSIIISFKGSINNNISKLHWITEDEHGMKSFTIERSVNNRDFYPIAIMPAMNENGQLFYEYPDKDVNKLAAQTFSYRLKITDANNKDNYSKIVTLSADNKDAVAMH